MRSLRCGQRPSSPRAVVILLQVARLKLLHHMTHKPSRSRGGIFDICMYASLSSVPPHPHRSLQMAPASSFLISGIFFLSEGARSTSPSYYVNYLSALDFINSKQFINISIRKYTPPSEPIQPNETIVFLVAKAALPAGEEGMLDAVHCTPFQLSWEDFKDCLPLIPTHTTSAVGTIGPVHTNTGSTRSFTINVSEYVRDKCRGFTVRFVFQNFCRYPLLTALRSRFEYETESGRWKNLRLPPTGSTIIATGAFKGRDEDCGEPILVLLDVSFSTPELVSASPTRTVGHRRIGK